MVNFVCDRVLHAYICSIYFCSMCLCRLSGDLDGSAFCQRMREIKGSPFKIRDLQRSSKIFLENIDFYDVLVTVGTVPRFNIARQTININY